MPNISKFSTTTGIDLSYDPKVLTYFYGLSDFWRVVFEDTEAINTTLQGHALSSSEIYNQFLQLTSTLSIEDIISTTNAQIKLQVISAANAVAGKVATYTLPEKIVGARYIANRPFLPTTTLEENVHFFIDSETGVVNFYKDISTLGFPSRMNAAGQMEYSLWFVDAKIDQELIYKYYGKLLQVTDQGSTEAFKNLVYGLYYLFINGPTLIDLKRGMNMVLGIPLAREYETVLDIRFDQIMDQFIVVTDQNSYFVPYGLEPTVFIGDTLSPGDEITSWVEVKDQVNDGEWWIGYSIPESMIPTTIEGNVARYAMPGNTVDYIMREYLSKNTFLIKITVGSFKHINTLYKFSELIKQLKASYTAPICVWTVPLIKDEIGLQEAINIKIGLKRYESLMSPIEQFVRKSEVPLLRGQPAFSRFTVSTDADIASGISTLRKGKPRPFNGGTVTGYVGTSARLVNDRPSLNIFPLSNDFVPVSYTPTDFSKAGSWVSTGVMVLQDVAEAPDNTITASKLISSGSGRNSVWTSNVRVKPNTKYTFSCHVKGAEINTARVFLDDTSTGYYGYSTDVNLTTSLSTNPSVISVTSMNNGWNRLKLSFTTPAVATSFVSRSGKGSYWDASGALVYADADIPRYTYNPATLTSEGLLVEKQSENLAKYVNSLGDHSYLKAGDIVRNNADIAPDNTSSAGFHIKSSATASSYVYRQNLGYGAKTVSLFVKPRGYTNYVISMSEAFSAPLSYNFDLVNLQTSLLKQDPYGWSKGNASISNVGNGWVRISLSGVHRAGAQAQVLCAVSDGVNYTADGIPNFTSTGGKGVLVWGMQVENGLAATSFIPETFVSRASNASYISIGGSVGQDSYNMLSRSEELDHADWVKFQSGSTVPVVNSTSIVSPIGLANAESISFPAVTVANSVSTVYRAVTATVGTPYTFSMWLKGAAGTEIVYLHTLDVTGAIYRTTRCALTTEWKRYSVCLTPGSGSNQIGLGVDLRDTTNQLASSAQTIFAWGAQLNKGWIPGDYSSTTSAARSLGRDGNDYLEYNQIGSSKSFADVSFWNTASASVITKVVGGSLSPDGSDIADLIRPTTANNTSHKTIYLQTLPKGVEASFGVYAKPLGYNFIKLQLNDTSASYAIFDLVAGTAISTGTGITSEITPTTDGWFRCSIAGVTDTASATLPSLYVMQTADPALAFAGDNVSGVQAWGAQWTFGLTTRAYTNNTGVSRTGSLVEGASKNLVVNSTIQGNLFDWFTNSWVSNYSCNDIAPDGTRTALSLGQSNASGVNRHISRSDLTIAPNVGTTVTVSCWIKLNKGVDAAPGVYFWNHTNPRSLELDVTSTWKRFKFTFDTTTAGTYFGIAFNWSSTGVANDARYSIWGYQVELGNEATSFIRNELSFTSRASNAWYFDQTGYLAPSLTNTPRVSYDPLTGLCEGLLAEPAATNLIFPSRVSSLVWVGTNVYLKDYAGVSPRNVVDASKVGISTIASVDHSAQISSALAATTRYSYSCFLKAGEITETRFVVTDAVASSITANINLTFGTVSSTVAGTAFNQTNISLRPIKDGWFRLSIEFYNVGAITGYIRQYTLSGGLTPHIGAVGDGFYIFGEQLEVNPYATTFIFSSTVIASRASTATYTDINGVIQTAAINVGRSGYDFNTLKVMGSVIESAATNLFTTSSDLTAGVKTNGTTATANTVVGPDGTTTADTLTLPALNAETSWAGLITAAGTYTFSVFAKGTGSKGFTLALSNITDGVVSKTFTAGTTWKRYDATLTVTGASDVKIINASETGDLIVWGAQIETGFVATSYIPTAGAQVTRAADVLTNSAGTRAADVVTSLIPVNREADVTYAVRGKDITSTPSYTVINPSISMGGVNSGNPNDLKSGVYIWGAQLEEGYEVTQYLPTAMDFVSRNGALSYFDTSGKLAYAGVNEKAESFDPVSGKSKGIVKDSWTNRGNVIGNSENFQVGWGNTYGLTLMPNSAFSPDRTENATLLLEAPVVGPQLIYYNVADSSPYNGNRPVFSFFVKAAGRSIAQVQINTVSNTKVLICKFNLASKSYNIYSLGGSAKGFAWMEELKDGWFRCTLSINTTISADMAVFIGPSDNTTYLNSHKGNANIGIYIFGAQLEFYNGMSYNYMPNTSGVAGAAVRTTYTLKKGERTTELSGVDREPQEELGWMRATIRRNSSNYIPRRSVLMTTQRGSDFKNPVGLGRQGTPSFADKRNVFMYVTDQADITAELGVLGFTVPTNLWSFTFNQNGPLSTLTANFTSLFVRSDVTLPDIFPEVSKLSVTVNQADLRQGDFLLFVKTYDNYYGVWWVTSNFDFTGKPYLEVSDPDPMVMELNGRPTRSIGRLGSPFYQTRGGLDTNGVTTTSLGVNSGTTKTATVVKYEDTVNTLQVITRTPGLNVISRTDIA